MATVCITGGTGLVGKRLISHLTEAGFDIIVFTRNAKGKLRNG
ncbi:MAG: NAD-dependent epimerase/dehydratase family protein, partial [Chitinophagaceae bacterium]